MSGKNFQIEIDGEVIRLDETGMAQIRRVTKLAQFLRTYGRQAIRETDFSGLAEGNYAGLVGFIIDFLGALDPEGLVLLGEVVCDRDAEFVRAHFDLNWIVDGLALLLQTPAFRKIIDSFFGGRG